MIIVRANRRRLALWILAGLGALLGAPAPGFAGTYEVLSCNSAPGAVNNAWTPSTSGNGNTSQLCPAGTGATTEGLFAGAGGIAGSRPSGDPFGSNATAMSSPRNQGLGRWALSAPSGTSLASFSGTWACSRTGHADTSLYSPSGGSGTGTCSSSGFSSVTRTFNTGATTLHLEAFVDCSLFDPGCDGSASWASLAEARVTVRDNQLPVGTITGGSLVSGGWKRGTHTVTYNASDGAGIRRVALVVDDTERGNTNYPCDYTRPAPCGSVTGGSQSLNTAQLSDGTHSIQLRSTDAADNSTLSTGQSFRSDNTQPALSLGGELYESSHEPLRGDAYDLEIEVGDGSGDVSGARRVEVFVNGVSQATREETCESGSDCDLDLIYTFHREGRAPGTHTVRVAAEDWAGNPIEQTFSVYLDSQTEPAPAPEEDTTISYSQSAAPRYGAGPGCTGVFERTTASDVVSWTHGARPDGVETTARYADGSYRVARCDTSGRLIRMQYVAPVSMPGEVAMLVVADSAPDAMDPTELGTQHYTYGDPADPVVIAAWTSDRTQLLSQVLPPTPS